MGADLVGYCRWFGNQVYEQFTGYDCFKSASALTYTTLFSIVPIMAVGYRTLAFLPEYDQVGDIVSNFIFRNFVPESSAIVQSQLADFSSRALQLVGPSSVILFVTSFLLLVTIEKSFNDIWQIHERRKGWSRLVNYWAVLTIGPPLLVASIVGSTYLLTFPLVTENAPLISQAMLAWLPIIAAIATFTVLFYAVPNTVVPFKHALAGGVMTAILFEIGKLGFRFMVTQVDIASVYGTFAAVPFFLMWLYMVWLLILAGGVFVRTLSLSQEVAETTPEPVVIKALRVLKILRDAHVDGEQVTEASINRAVPMTREEHEQIVAVLRQQRLLQTTEEDRWVLARSLRDVSLWSLHSHLPGAMVLENFEGVGGLESITERFLACAAFGHEQLDVSIEEVLAS